MAARVAQLQGVSGHADSAGLMDWIRAVKGVKRVFVVHGEDTVTDLFAARLRDELHLNAEAPYPGEQWDLSSDTMTAPGNREKIVKGAPAPEETEAAAEEAEEERKDDPSRGYLDEVYRELGRRIAAVKTKRERNKLAAQINKLLKKMR